jgi:hypothetical protein
MDSIRLDDPKALTWVSTAAGERRHTCRQGADRGVGIVGISAGKHGKEAEAGEPQEPAHAERSMHASGHGKSPSPREEAGFEAPAL